MSLEDNISSFSGHFSARIKEVGNVESHLFRKILYINIIDTLSRVASPDVRHNRARVTKFIDQCSGWKDKDRVSAQQLMLMLQEAGRTCGNLYKLAKETVDSWEYGSVIHPESDLTDEAARALARKDERDFVSQVTYKKLFYAYRNYLIHEFREPGYGIGSNSDSVTPYYHSMIGEPCQLVFPTPFIRRICIDSLKGLAALLRSQQRNPYDSYGFGSLWRTR